MLVCCFYFVFVLLMLLGGNDCRVNGDEYLLLLVWNRGYIVGRGS